MAPSCNDSCIIFIYLNIYYLNIKIIFFLEFLYIYTIVNFIKFY